MVNNLSTTLNSMTNFSANTSLNNNNNNRNKQQNLPPHPQSQNHHQISRKAKDFTKFTSGNSYYDLKFNREENKENASRQANLDLATFNNTAISNSMPVDNYSFRNSKQNPKKINSVQSQVGSFVPNNSKTNFGSICSIFNTDNFESFRGPINGKKNLNMKKKDDASHFGQENSSQKDTIFGPLENQNGTFDQMINTQTFGRDNLDISEEGYLNQWKKSKLKKQQVQEVSASDRFPVLKGKLNKSLVDFFLQDDGADESIYQDENSLLGAI